LERKKNTHTHTHKNTKVFSRFSTKVLSKEL